MEGSATIQPPSPDCREPWLHTAVMRGILVEALGPACLTEHGVDHPSLVHVCDSHVQHLTIVIMIAFCAVICPDLSLTNGQVLYSDTTPPRAEGSTATYICGNGYQISGESMRMCTASGWSGSPPSCLGLLIDWFPLWYYPLPNSHLSWPHPLQWIDQLHSNLHLQIRGSHGYTRLCHWVHTVLIHSY